MPHSSHYSFRSSSFIDSCLSPFYDLFLFPSRSRALHLYRYYSLLLFFSLLSCLSLFILTYSPCSAPLFFIKFTLLFHSLYSFSLTYSPLFLHIVIFFFIPFLSRSLNRYLSLLLAGLLCFAHAALISLPLVSSSHLHSHDAFFAFLFPFRVQCSRVFLFFHVFITAVELFSLLYLLLFLILASDFFLLHAPFDPRRAIFLFFFFLRPTIFFFRMNQRFIPLVLGRFKISQFPNGNASSIEMRISVKLFIGSFRILYLYTEYE